MRWIAVFLILTIFLSVESSIWGKSVDTTKILEITRKGKTAVLDRGSLDGLAKRDYAAWVDKYLVRVAEGRAEKVFDNYSIWYFPFVINREKMKKGERYYIVDAKTQDARFKPIEMDEKLLVAPEFSEKAVKELLREKQRGFPKEWVKGEDIVKEAPLDWEEWQDPDVLSKKRINRIGIGQWVKKGTVKNYKAEKIENKVYVKKEIIPVAEQELRRKLLRQRLRNRVQHFQESAKIQQNEKERKELYRLQRKDPHIGELQEETKLSDYDKYWQEVKEEKLQKKNVITKLKKEYGGSWSQNMSDEELADYMAYQGIQEENIRQQKAVSGLGSQQFYGSVAFPLQTELNKLTPSKNRPLHEFGFGWEYYLGKVIRPLRLFSLETNFTIPQDMLVGDNFDVEYSGWALGVTINYYFLRHPSLYQTWQPFLGVGFRAGLVTMDGQNISDDGNIFRSTYRYATLPLLQVGMKYNFRTGFGARGILSYRKSDFGLQNVEFSDDKRTVPEAISSTEYRIGLAFIYMI